MPVTPPIRQRRAAVEAVAADGYRHRGVSPTGGDFMAFEAMAGERVGIILRFIDDA